MKNSTAMHGEQHREEHEEHARLGPADVGYPSVHDSEVSAHRRVSHAQRDAVCAEQCRLWLTAVLFAQSSAVPYLDQRAAVCAEQCRPSSTRGVLSAQSSAVPRL